MNCNFSFASTPHIHFGAGERQKLLSIVQAMGTKALLVTGGTSFNQSNRCQALWQSLQLSLDVRRVSVSGEPSPDWVDKVVQTHRGWMPDCVIAIGGGSAVDAAKAVAGLLLSGDSVMQYLEGVGEGKIFSGITTPLIALPTTAGTGGETSKNAVLSVIGEHGFKKSFRHESLVAKHIILDPELTLSCPAHVTAACGMDAFTQLLESFVSTHANPMTDALAWSGLQQIKQGLLAAFGNGEDIEARASMLYASSISGLTLANAGLGSVHGLASPLGAFFPIPHGVVCGALLYEAVRINIDAMLAREPENIALKKYADVGRMMCGDEQLDDNAARQSFLRLLKTWSAQLNMPKLSNYGVKTGDIPKLIAHISGGSMATNPIVLTDVELTQLIQAVL